LSSRHLGTVCGQAASGNFHARGSAISRAAVVVALIWAGLILVSLFVRRSFPDAPSLCLFKNLTDHPCPTCGSTRAVLALAKGQFTAAFSSNPLMTVLILATPLLLVLARLSPGLWRRSTPGWILLSLMALNWVYLLFAAH